MIEAELNKIIETSDEGGRRAAQACLAMLNFTATFAGVIREQSANEANHRLADEFNNHIRQAALGPLVTEELLQHAIDRDNHASCMSSLGGVR